MLTTLLVLALQTTPISELIAEEPQDHFGPPHSDLTLTLTSLVGAEALQGEIPPAPRGVILGMRAGVRGTWPPAFIGAARIGIQPAIALRFDTGSGRTDWTGFISLTIHYAKLRFAVGAGYGLTLRGDIPPRPVFEFGGQVGMKIGPLTAGLGMELVKLPGSRINSMQIVGLVGTEWEFWREVQD
ncbi:MAG: hypothetical protein QM817_38925 [Archangium sp.]